MILRLKIQCATLPTVPEGKYFIRLLKNKLVGRYRLYVTIGMTTREVL